MDVERRYTHPNPVLRRYHLRRLTMIIREIKSIAKAYAGRELSFLDVGCGDGTYIVLLRGVFAHLIGLDISLRDLKIANERARNKDGGITDFILADVTYLPFRSSSIDVVICSEVLEHLYNPAKALKELSRISRKALLVTVPILGVLRLIVKIFQYHRVLNKIESHVGHVYMRNRAWWISVISEVLREEKAKYGIKIIYSYLSAEPFASMFCTYRNTIIYKIIDKVLEILEKILSCPTFANELIIIISTTRATSGWTCYSRSTT